MTAPGPANPPVKSQARIQGLFARIAPWYDFLNHLLTLGIDRRWRRRVAAGLELPPGARVLDVACGTGDLSLLVAEGGYRVMGADFCMPMLELCRRKAPRVPVLQADALRLPLADEAVDAVTVAFGVRNFEDPHAGLAEIGRVLKAGGTLAVLEFGVPAPPVLRHAYLLYFRRVLPLLGRLVSRDPFAYRYLSDSVMHFPHGAAFADLLRGAGLEPFALEPLTFGIAWLYLARRPAARPSRRGARPDLP